MSKKISELSAAGALTGTEVVPVVQNGNTVKTTAQDIANLGGGASTTKVYRALLSQSGTDAPVATVLENTIGDIVWTRTDVGQYTATLTGAFPLDKTLYKIQNAYAVTTIGNTGNSNSFEIFTFETVTTYSDTQADSQLSSASVEVLVYP